MYKDVHPSIAYHSTKNQDTSCVQQISAAIIKDDSHQHENPGEGRGLSSSMYSMIPFFEIYVINDLYEYKY